ncbi:MAG: type II toxin-antitoxin system HicB family antitoxin [Pseudomonadota bacterium]
MHYIALVHEEDGVFGVSFPDLPGCISAGEALDEALQNAQEALALHAEGLIADGETLPAPRSAAEIRADAGLADWHEGSAFAVVPVVIDRGSFKRVNISLDPGLLEAIDAEAEAQGVTRSAWLASAARKEITGHWAPAHHKRLPVATSTGGDG